MAGVFTVGRVLISVLQILIMLALGYYYLLVVAGASQPKRAEDKRPAETNRTLPYFAVMIPAHNEAAVLSRTLQQLEKQRYPRARFDVFVIADHCNDGTAEVVGACGAILLERTAAPQGRKVYALQWGFEQLLGRPPGYDAFVIFDADSRVDPGFLKAMAAKLDKAHRVLQGQHIILQPEHRLFSGVATIDMRLNNLLRNQAKTNLGLSCRLMGDAMCFDAGVIREHGWPADSLGEDRQFGIYLVSHGVKATYVPEAISYGQAAPSWRSASKQRLRWYGGFAETQRKLTLQMLRYGLRHHSLAALDQAVELLIPPLSILGALSFALLAVQLIWIRQGLLVRWPAWVGVTLLWLSLPFWGLLAARVPADELRALLTLPAYIAWRLWIGIRARLMGNQVRWVRTQRQEEV